jgi:heat shock protein HslJ
MKVGLLTATLITLLSTPLVWADSVALSRVPTGAVASSTTNTVVVKPSLTNMSWQLVSIQAPKQKATTLLKSGVPAQTYKIAMGKNGLLGTQGCNNMSFGYQVVGTQLKIKSGVSTLMACSGKLGQADQEISGYLKGTLSYQLVGSSTLKLTTADKTVLTLKGTPTNEAKYQGEGKIKFIEVITQKTGTKWREVTFDKDFIKKTYGAWHQGSAGVDGFRATPGYRELVRVKEFNNSATNSKVWVFDMVSEVELITKK